MRKPAMIVAVPQPWMLDKSLLCSDRDRESACLPCQGWHTSAYNPNRHHHLVHNISACTLQNHHRFNLEGYYGMAIMQNTTYRKVEVCATPLEVSTDGLTVLDDDDTLKYDPTTGNYMTQLRVSSLRQYMVAPGPRGLLADASAKAYIGLRDCCVMHAAAGMAGSLEQHLPSANLKTWRTRGVL